MNLTVQRPVWRAVFVLGLAAAIWPIPSTATPGTTQLLPTGGAVAIATPDLVQLAQAATVSIPSATDGTVSVDAAAVDARVTFAADQADRGEKRFIKECVDCHGEDLKGGLNGGAVLRGLGFEAKFADGAPASGLFMFMSMLMPPDAPGRFSPTAYADMMAFILKVNGFEEGAPLPSDPEALDHLIMTK